MRLGENNLLLKIIQNRADCDLRQYINQNNLSKKIKISKKIIPWGYRA